MFLDPQAHDSLGNAQTSGRSGLVPLAFLEGLDNKLPLEVVQGLFKGIGRAGPARFRRLQ